MKKRFIYVLSLMLVTYYLIPLLKVEGMAKGIDTPYIPVLMYHAFIDGRNDNISVDPERFREQVKALKEAGYEGITATDYYEFLQGKKTLPEKPIMLTFDDGYLNNYTRAFPILQEMDMKATIFVIVRSREEKLGTSDHFDWDQAREMISSGLIDIQSHSFDSHRYEPSLHGNKPLLVARLLKEDGSFESEKEYAYRVNQDLKLAKEKIERELAIRVVALAYPYGVFDDQVEGMARDLGHVLTFSVRAGLFVIGDYPSEIPRINVDGRLTGDDLLRLIEKHKKHLPTKGKIHVKWNEQYLLSKVEPVMQHQTVYVPLSLFRQKDDMHIDWRNNLITISYKAHHVIIDPVQKTVRSSDDQTEEPIDIVLKNQHSYLPIRTLANLLDLDIQFQSQYLGPHHLVQILER